MDISDKNTTEGRKFFLFFFLNRKVLFAYALLILLPAFLSCTEKDTDFLSGSALQAEAGITIDAAVPVSETAEAGCIDIFIFNNDSLGWLDSYQRFNTGFSSGPLTAASRKGDKIIVAVANSANEKSDWSSISSLEGMMKSTASIWEEDPASPVMCGTAEVSMGEETSCSIEMVPLLSEIKVNSLCCDFTGRPYEDEVLSDIKIYLINVNAAVPIFHEEDFMPTEIINAAGLSEEDMARISHPEMLSCRMDSQVGNNTVYPGISLYCFPNDCPEQSLGSPFTRLVIEGKLCGHTCYYPIDINRGNDIQGRAGIGRNSRYVYDIILTRAGTSDPDIAADATMVDINMTVRPWNEQDEDEITF